MPDQSSELGKKEQVEQMFDSIAGKYDFLNRLLSFRIDVLWRNRMVRMLRKSQPKYILDEVIKKSSISCALK